MQGVEPLYRILYTSNRVKLLEILTILSTTAVLFYYLKNDMKTFGFCVYAGLLYVVYSSPNYKSSAVIGLTAGFVGAMTEHWGCSQGLWNWVDPSFNPLDQPTKSLWMIDGAPKGYPVEVVVAYAGAGFWMNSISLHVLAPEHTDMVERNVFNRRRRSCCSVLRQHFSVFLTEYAVLRHLFAVKVAILTLMIMFEPAFLQAALLMLVGVFSTVLLPSNRIKLATVWWGLVVGFCGLFFEIYATGGLFQEFAVWRYDRQKQAAVVQEGSFKVNVPFVMGTAPLSAFPAYVGTGLIIFSMSFWATAILAPPPPRVFRKLKVKRKHG
jgi:hypothetical protein